jgi:FixJ family two-component response regulator
MISIVDDDKSVRDATRSLLRAHGYRALAFASAEEFLQSDQVDDTSCLISDVRMPGLSGLQLQRLLTRQGRQMPIIFVSVSQEERTRAQALKAGAVGFLPKPFSAGRLIEYVRTALANPKPQQAISPA